MGVLLFFLLIVVPVAELYVIVQVGQEIGFLLTLVLLIGISVAGAWLLKREGTATWGRLQQTLARGEMPTNEVTDGALILLGGALLLTPGFLTDIVGMVFLIPPSRAVVKSGSRKVFGSWVKRKTGVASRVGSRVYEANVVRRTRPSEKSPTGSPREELPRAEDDSPDRG